MSDSAESLKYVKLFSTLNDKELAEVTALCTWHGYPPGTHVLDRLADTMDVFFVTRGQVRVLIYSESGREISITDVGEGEIFGEFSALDGKPRSANVVTVYSTTVAQMSAETFLHVLHNYPSVSVALLKHLTAIVRNATSRIMDLSTLTAHCRVYEEIRKLGEKRHNQLGTYRISPIPVHADIASRVSTTRETVARVFSELTRKKIIRKERNVLIINDMPALEALIKANS